MGTDYATSACSEAPSTAATAVAERLSFAEVLKEEIAYVRGRPASDGAIENELNAPSALIGNDRIEGLPADLSALCLSGGGIRSATFNLGVIQGLAQFGLLSGFDFLSTVSGGGYL